MHSLKVLSAVVALGASAVSAATCTKDVKITEATQVIDCEVVDADILVDSDLGGEVVINGPEQIKGDLIVKGAKGLTSLSSTSINSIEGKFELNNLEALSNLQFSSLTDLNSLVFITLPRLSSLNFGTEGVTEVSSIRITDTRISDLSGLSVATVKDFQIDNNRKMTSFNSDLVNITGTLIISKNGNNMAIQMHKLEKAADIQISSVKSFEVPALEEVSKGIALSGSPELKSFAAPNLTKVTEGVSFFDNKKLTNISMPELESIGGAFKIENNTALESIDDFGKLEKVYGGISLRGSFEKVELPKLEQVRGTVVVTSTTDISEFCDPFQKLDDDGAIDGGMTCTSNNKKANEGGDEGEETSSSDSSEDEEDAAGIVGVNMAVLALVGVVALAQLF
ncbi:hypothetical protein FZEAL_7841 [Fusarium zealandicum]|uniref:Uncharacterized protein n=1 Tax=Fusarium zealandicum TaxID=1053134 RepID=A0A8H4UF23_9HYPO|nr:hypothetical protein FZEAL_7841 [Fusarium zealandicum]